MLVTARCRVPSRVGARVPCRVSTRVPGRVDAQLAPSSHPSRPHKPCRSQPLSTAGLWGSQQWGRVEKKREEIAEGEEWGLLLVPASPGCPPQPSSRGHLPCFIPFIRLAFTWQKDLFVLPGCLAISAAPPGGKNQN